MPPEKGKLMIELLDGREVEVKTRMFSPCVDSLGDEFHLVIYTARHPMMKDAPMRVVGTGATRARAHAHAKHAFAHAHHRLTRQAGRRTQETLA